MKKNNILRGGYLIDAGSLLKLAPETEKLSEEKGR